MTSAPFDTDGLSPYLSTSMGVIEEAMRVHLNLLRDLLAGKEVAILFSWASFENKGEPSISIGEAILLEQMDIGLLLYISVL